MSRILQKSSGCCRTAIRFFWSTASSTCAATEHGVGIKNLTMNESQFGHSAENPVMPGVLVIEGIAQTACVLALRLMPPTERRRIMFFMSIDKAKFRKPARPGDTRI